MSRRLAFVWFYWAAGAAGDELRWSLRSVCRFYDGEAVPIVVGDRPAWYNGVHIECPRIGPVMFRRYYDTLHKLRITCASGAVPEEFIWISDDSYWLRSFRYADTTRARHCGLLAETRIAAMRNGNRWNQLKHHTFTALRSRGFPTYDYATPHSPRHVTKANALSLLENWTFAGKPYIWNLLYGNVYNRDHGVPTREIYWVPKRRSLEDIQTGLRPEHRILNSGSTAWNAGLRQFLKSRLPDPAPFESNQKQALL